MKSDEVKLKQGLKKKHGFLMLVELQAIQFLSINHHFRYIHYIKVPVNVPVIKCTQNNALIFAKYRCTLEPQTTQSKPVVTVSIWFINAVGLSSQLLWTKEASLSMESILCFPMQTKRRWKAKIMEMLTGINHSTSTSAFVIPNAL